MTNPQTEQPDVQTTPGQEDNFSDMDDATFEAMLNSAGSPEQMQEPHSEAPSVSDESVDEIPAEDVNSTENGENEPEIDPEGEDLGEAEGQSEDGSEAQTPETEEEGEGATQKTEDGLEELYKPFRASGRDFQVKSIDEAKKLMSMGVDYAQKIQGFKEHRRTIKTLEQNKVSQDDLNFLIDLKNGNPQAIAKLLEDHKLDAMDLEQPEGSNYTPSDHSVSAEQVELDEVISRIQGTDSFSRTSDIVTNQWDADSKKVLLEQPQLLEVLNEQVSNGTYQRIMTEVERARVFGGLQGLSDLQAYDTVGKQMYAQQQQDQPKSAPPVVSKAPKVDKSATDRKRNASPAKRTATQAKPPQKSFATMSDAEFERELNKTRY